MELGQCYRRGNAAAAATAATASSSKMSVYKPFALMTTIKPLKWRLCAPHFIHCGLFIVLLSFVVQTAPALPTTNRHLIDLAPLSMLSSDQSLMLSSDQQQETPLIVASALTSSGGEKPRLIPLVVADSGYSENSSVNILCTVSQGHHESLTFDWFKDGQLIEQQQQQANLIYNNLPQRQFGTNLKISPQIEKHQDHSLLRISRVQSDHSGRYTCAAKNQFGQDSSSVQLKVNGNYCRF